MAFRSNNSTGYKKQMTVTKRHERARVGDNYADRYNQKKQGTKLDAPKKQKKSSFFSRIKSMILGGFEPGEYVMGSPTIPMLHKELEQGIKGSLTPDKDLLAIISHVKKTCPK